MLKKIDAIPIFPLNGALLLPGGNLPLNIFEPRYILMVDYAFTKDKIIGMIQHNKEENSLYKCGCAGKITSFNETEDNRYLINLHGLSKFVILNEKKENKDFRIFEVQYKNQDLDYNNFNKSLFDKNIFINKIKLFFKKNRISIDFESMLQIEDKSLITMIAMISPFEVNEKQMMLEAKNIDELLKILEALLDFSINNELKNDSIN